MEFITPYERKTDVFKRRKNRLSSLEAIHEKKLSSFSFRFIFNFNASGLYFCRLV